MNLKKLKKKIGKYIDIYDGIQNVPFELGQKVLEARILSGLTQAELAAKVGTKQPAIARIESGSTEPSVTMFVKISYALGCGLELPIFKGLPRFEVRTSASSVGNSSIRPPRLVDVINGFAIESAKQDINSKVNHEVQYETNQ